MSRLHIKHNSDLRKGTGHCASQECGAGIYWGSANNSKLCAEIDIIWRKESKSPTMTIRLFDGTKKEYKIIEKEGN